MTLTRFKSPTISSGLTKRKREWNKTNRSTSSHSLINHFCKFSKELGYTDGARSCHLSALHRRNSLLSPLVAHRNPRFPVFRNKLSSGFGVDDVEERLTLNEEEDTTVLSSTINVDIQ